MLCCVVMQVEWRAIRVEKDFPPYMEVNSIQNNPAGLLFVPLGTNYRNKWNERAVNKRHYVPLPLVSGGVSGRGAWAGAEEVNL